MSPEPSLASEQGLHRFAEYLNEEMRDLEELPTDKIGQIIHSIEDHRKVITGYNAAVIAAVIGILAALIGGITGSLVTLLFGHSP